MSNAPAVEDQVPVSPSLKENFRSANAKHSKSTKAKLKLNRRSNAEKKPHRTMNRKRNEDSESTMKKMYYSTNTCGSFSNAPAVEDRLAV